MRIVRGIWLVMVFLGRNGWLNKIKKDAEEKKWLRLTDDMMICWLDDDCESWEIRKIDYSKLKVNGNLKQNSNTKNLLFKVPDLMEYITKFFTMEAGDIIATGTPGGIGPIKPGDLIEASIEKIGTLTNEVILEKELN